MKKQVISGSELGAKSVLEAKETTQVVIKTLTDEEAFARRYIRAGAGVATVSWLLYRAAMDLLSSWALVPSNSELLRHLLLNHRYHHCTCKLLSSVTALAER